jgi:hypothetical protein
MELVKTKVFMRFSEAFSPWLGMRNLIRSAGESTSVEIEGPPIILDLKKLKQRVVINIKTFEFLQEGTDSIDDSTNIAMNKLMSTNSSSKFPQIEQISYESVFIEPYAIPFHELLRLIKERFIRPSTLVDSTTDVGLLFDQVEGDVLKHFQIGPMGKEQLSKMYVQYIREKTPEEFVFLSLQYRQSKNISFDKDFVQTFLQTAGHWQMHQAKLVFKYLKEGI